MRNLCCSAEPKNLKRPLPNLPCSSSADVRIRHVKGWQKLTRLPQLAAGTHTTLVSTVDTTGRTLLWLTEANKVENQQSPSKATALLSCDIFRPITGLITEGLQDALWWIVDSSNTEIICGSYTDTILLIHSWQNNGSTLLRQWENNGKRVMTKEHCSLSSFLYIGFVNK